MAARSPAPTRWLRHRWKGHRHLDGFRLDDRLARFRVEEGRVAGITTNEPPQEQRGVVKQHRDQRAPVRRQARRFGTSELPVDPCTYRADDLVPRFPGYVPFDAQMVDRHERDSQRRKRVRDGGLAALRKPTQRPTVGEADTVDLLDARRDAQLPGRHLKDLCAPSPIENLLRPAQDMGIGGATPTVTDHAVHLGRGNLARDSDNGATFATDGQVDHSAYDTRPTRRPDPHRAGSPRQPLEPHEPATCSDKLPRTRNLA